MIYSSLGFFGHYFTHIKILPYVLYQGQFSTYFYSVMRIILLITTLFITMLAQANGHAIIRFGQIQSSCEDGTMQVAIEVSNTDGRTFKANNWSGKFTYNTDLVDYPALKEATHKGNFEIIEGEEMISFNYNAKNPIALPGSGEWVTLAVIEFEIQSFFNTKSNRGIDLKWKHSYEYPAVTAKNLTGRGQVAIYNYGDANPGIQEVCPVMGAAIKQFKAEKKENTVVLDWSTTAETTNKGFEVEYAKVTGMELDYDFKKLTFIKGKGSASQYSFNVADLSEGKHMFRLKQLDKDGLYEYTDAITVSIDHTIEPTEDTRLDAALGMR